MAIPDSVISIGEWAFWWDRETGPLCTQETMWWDREGTSSGFLYCTPVTHHLVRLRIIYQHSIEEKTTGDEDYVLHMGYVVL